MIAWPPVWPPCARDTLHRLREREPFWGELGSGLGAVMCGVFSFAVGAPLEHHPVLGGLAVLIGGHVVEAVWIAAGLGQLCSVITDRWRWRWVAALGMTAGWSIPVLQVFKSPADAPVLAGSCAAWVFVNAAAAWCLVRRGLRGDG